MKSVRLVIHLSSMGLLTALMLLLLFAVWMQVAAVLVFGAGLALIVLFSWALFTYRRRGQAQQEALEASEERFRGMFEASPIGIGIADEQGRLVSTNPALRAMVGRSGENLAGLPLSDLNHPDDAKADAALFRELMSGARPHYQIEKRCVAAEGDVIWVRSTSFLLDCRTGRQQLHVVMLEDITERKRAEEALRASEAQLATQVALTNVLTEPASLDEMTRRLLQTLAEGAGWDVGVVWGVEHEDKVLRCAEFWHSPSILTPEFQALIQQLALAPGDGLPGRVWQRGESEYLGQIAGDGNGHRALKASREGLREAFAFPVSHHGRVHAVFEFLSCRDVPRSGRAVDMLTAAGSQFAAQFSWILEREQTAETLRASEERYRTITEIARDAVITIDEGGVMLAVNRAAEEMFGYERDELLGRPLTILMPESYREPHTKALQRYCETGARRIRWDMVELPGLCKSGDEILLEVSLVEVRQDHRRTFTGYLRDITVRKREESALVYQALHDALTELPNRVLLHERLQRAILLARRQSSPLALLFMDLDRFKEVNDTFGHPSGDRVLREVASRLLTALRQSDTVARLGGDEFAMLLPNTDTAGAEQAAERIQAMLLPAFTLDGHNFDVGASVGIAVYPHHGTDSDSLMRHADSAMYVAKRLASGHAVYSQERDKRSPMRLKLSGELRQAIESQQLLLYYQPKVRLRNGVVHEVEALIRWQHPDRGIMAPDGFIPLAEETGLVKPLTEWVLNEALRQHRAWREQGLDLRVAVNISPRILHDPELGDTISRLLRNWNVEPSRLEVEITESAIMVDPEGARKALTGLHDAGIWTSIDDFGTGYSSLSYLKQQPVDEIKIDKSFVLEMASNRDDASIVRSVVTLGHSLGLQVVAEGVDNKRTLDMLTAMECDMAQGYFLARPKPEAELVDWLRSPRSGLSGVA